MTEVTFGSVCSGIEAASVAWTQLGWRAAWLAEVEPHPAKVLHHHYGAGRPLHMLDPDADGLSDADRKARRAAIKSVAALPDRAAGPRNLGDMTKIAAMVRAGTVYAPDLLVGGTPCQAFSFAGLRNSLDDARGQLTLSFVDLANAIDTARHVRGEPAAVIVWENVRGVLSTKDNAFGCFLGALAGEDCELKPPGKKWPNAGCVYGPQRAVAWRVLDAQYFGVAQRRFRVFVVASARDGFDPSKVLFEFEGLRRDSPPAGIEAGDEAVTATGEKDRCWWDGGQISQTLDAVLYKKQSMPEKNRFPAVIDGGRLRYITVTEAERLQGFSDGHTDVPNNGKSAPDGPRYKAIGNSMAVPVMAWLGRRVDMILARTANNS